jgi:ribosomal protein S12 methylthiotransferase accessory factor
MTRYSRLAVPRIDLRGAPSREVGLLASVISDTGREVLAFDTTMEHGVPSVWARPCIRTTVSVLRR